MLDGSFLDADRLSVQNAASPLNVKRGSRAMSDHPERTKPQLLHLVFGGEVESPDSHTFVDVDNLD